MDCWDKNWFDNASSEKSTFWQAQKEGIEILIAQREIIVRLISVM
jgi:hypothetical protein